MYIDSLVLRMCMVRFSHKILHLVAQRLRRVSNAGMGWIPSRKVHRVSTPLRRTHRIQTAARCFHGSNDLSSSMVLPITGIKDPGIHKQISVEESVYDDDDVKTSDGCSVSRC